MQGRDVFMFLADSDGWNPVANVHDEHFFYIVFEFGRSCLVSGYVYLLRDFKNNFNELEEVEH